MSIYHSSSFTLELLKGLHDVENDTIKLALFNASASFSKDTTAYSAANEISGSGYTAGGATLTLTSSYPKLEDDFGSARFEQASWTFGDVVTVKWALMYNASSSNRSILAIEFPNAIEISGVFNVNFPLTLPPIIQLRHPGA